MGELSRPRVFLSSTILDFADLRSSIKYWLEESGYEVNASEFNDFQKEVERNSYDACLASIDSCQYFVLLIGARAGGRLAHPSNTTITMAEYRRAYERAKEGRLKIVALVRRSIWTVREDRSALENVIKAKYQEEHGLTVDDVSALKHHASRIIVDADIIFEFISEVTRSAEMRAASKDPAVPLPVNNWIHTFETFRDVVDVLRSAFVRDEGLHRIALLANLKQELITNLSSLFRYKNGALVPYCQWASNARSQFSGDPEGVSTIRGKDLTDLAAFAYTSSDSLLVHALDAAIDSGAFLTFDTAKHEFITGEIQSALLELREASASVKSLTSGYFTIEKRAELLDFKKYRGQTSGVEIPNRQIAMLIVLHDRTKNVIELSLALIRFIETRKYSPPRLLPASPFPDQDEQQRAARPSTDDIIGLAIGASKNKIYT